MTHWSANGAMEQAGVEIHNPICPAKERGGGASSAFCLCAFGAATGFEVWHVGVSAKFWETPVYLLRNAPKNVDKTTAASSNPIEDGFVEFVILKLPCLPE